MASEALPIGDRVRAVIARQINREPGEIGDDYRLAALGVESIDAMEILFALEEEFGIDIPFNANKPDEIEMDSVGAVTRSVTALLARHE